MITKNHQHASIICEALSKTDDTVATLKTHFISVSKTYSVDGVHSIIQKAVTDYFNLYNYDDKLKQFAIKSLQTANRSCNLDINYGLREFMTETIN